MSTENPKVSAYVPQVVKDRLKEFRDERKMSESQAVTVILAEYFQLTEALGRSLNGTGVGGVTLARMEAIEEKLTNVVASVEHRLQQLREEIGKISGLPIVYQVTLEPTVSESEQSGSLPSKPLTASQELEQVVAVGEEQNSSLSEELPTEILNQKDNTDEKLGKPQDMDSSVIPGKPVSELPVNEESKQEGSMIEAPEAAKETSEPASSLPSESLEEKANHAQIPLVLGVEESEEESTRIDIALLARRVGITAASVNNKKSKLTSEEFVKWTVTKDIDGIGWRKAKEGNRVYYEPARALESESLSRLLVWIRKNRS